MARSYNKMKSTKTPEKLAELKTERDRLSAEIKTIRRELFLLGDIEKRSEEIRQKLQRQREYQERQLNPKTKIKERGYVR